MVNNVEPVTEEDMKVSIIYDGQCPVCRHLVGASRLRDRSAQLDLVDARGADLSDVQGRDLTDLDFDEGFCVVVDGDVHHGPEGARMLALLTGKSGLCVWLFKILMRTERRSRFCYPVLKSARALLLRLIRVPKFSESDRH